MDEMRLAGKGLLDRLDTPDRVVLVLPEILGPDADWSSPDRAHRVLQGLRRLPVCGSQLPVASIDRRADHVYHLAASALDITIGPGVSRIDVPTGLSSVTIDAIGAERIASDKLQVFAALRNESDKPVAASLTVSDALGSVEAAGVFNVTVQPNSRRSVIAAVRPAEALLISVAVGGAQVAQAYLVRVKTSARTVAIIGADDPYLRRLIEVDPALELVSDQSIAEIVIANGVSAPVDKPALVIAPPTAPAPWRLASKELASVMLADADVTGDDPIMRGVDLGPAAIRRVRPWVRGEVTGGGVLVGYKGSVLAIRTADDADASQPRRVHLAFDLSENNCTLVRTDAYVIFLANVMRYLSPGSSAVEKYEYRTPLQAGVNPAWKPIAGDKTFAASALESANLTAPGIYRDGAGRLHAVSLVGLRSSPAARTPAQAVAAAILPDGRPLTQGIELWSILLALAAMLWLGGWSAAALRD
jgi:hypothetical protein